MRALITPFLMAAALALQADAQILRVSFKTEKDAKKYKKHTIELGDELVLLGEPVPGGGIRIERNRQGGQTINYKGGEANEFFVFDPRDPSKVPYRMENGEPVGIKKSSVVRVQGKHIRAIQYHMRTETIETVAREYRLRYGRIEDLKAQRDAYDKGTVEWFATQARVLAAYERLESWLGQNSFTDRAKKIAKEREKEAKTSSESIKSRYQTAKDSIEITEGNEQIAAAAAAAGNAGYTFKFGNSQHLRFTYETSVMSDAQAEELLLLGEKVIEGFRNQFVDPYLGEDFAEHIPDEQFLEICWVPDDRSFHEKFVVEYYGIPWPQQNRARYLEATGNWRRKSSPHPLLMYRRYVEPNDFDGEICHQLGHALSSYHFSGGPNNSQVWMEEGLGYYLSFEFLGRNSVSCFELRETNYVEPDKKEGAKTVMVSYRDTLNAMALEAGPRIDRLLIKFLIEMEDPDLAKSWSFFEYIARSTDKVGQRWMRATAQFARDRATFIDKLRPLTEEMYGITGQDVFKVLDERWRKYATTEMDTEW